MLLIDCPACTKAVSKNAASCPYCGEPIAAKNKGYIALPAVMGLGFLLLAGVFVKYQASLHNGQFQLQGESGSYGPVYVVLICVIVGLVMLYLAISAAFD